MPVFATATVRLEVLANLACLHCRGDAAPTSDDLRRWVNDVLGGLPLQRLEDPLEDVVVSSVRTPSGNYRLVEGTWELADANLQDAVDVLTALPPGGDRARVVREIRALLALSEAECARAGVARWAVPEEVLPRREVLPETLAVEDLGRRATFTPSELDVLGVDVDDLGPFVWLPAAPPKAKRRKRVVNQPRGRDEAPPLERRPVTLFGDRVVLACPPSVSAAARSHVLSWTRERGMLRAFAEAVRELQRTRLETALGASRFAGPLEGAQALLPPNRLPPGVDEQVVGFDDDKFAHVLLVHDDLQQASKSVISQPA